MKEGVKGERGFAKRKTAGVRLHAEPVKAVASLGPRAREIVLPLLRPTQR